MPAYLETRVKRASRRGSAKWGTRFAVWTRRLDCTVGTITPAFHLSQTSSAQFEVCLRKTRFVMIISALAGPSYRGYFVLFWALSAIIRWFRQYLSQLMFVGRGMLWCYLFERILLGWMEKTLQLSSALYCVFPFHLEVLYCDPGGKNEWLNCTFFSSPSRDSNPKWFIYVWKRTRPYASVKWEESGYSGTCFDYLDLKSEMEQRHSILIVNCTYEALRLLAMQLRQINTALKKIKVRKTLYIFSYLSCSSPIF